VNKTPGKALPPALDEFLRFVLGWLASGIAGLTATTLAQAAGVDPALPRYDPRAIVVAPSAGYLTADGAVAVVGYNDMRDMPKRACCASGRS
jgi:hypothetical protein